jgi:flavin-dependent dehydrogenase
MKRAGAIAQSGGSFLAQGPRNQAAPGNDGKAQPLDKYRVTADYCFCHSRFADEGLFMIGDAASFIDPTFSSGVSLACASASRAVETLLRLKRTGRPFNRREQARFTRYMKGRVRTVRQLVESFYDPASFEIFMQPTNRWKVFPAVNAVMAGHHTAAVDRALAFSNFPRGLRHQPLYAPSTPAKRWRHEHQAFPVRA